MSSDDEWITEIEEPVLPENGAWLNVLDRAARRAAREASNVVGENNDDPSQSKFFCENNNNVMCYIPLIDL